MARRRETKAKTVARLWLSSAVASTASDVIQPIQLPRGRDNSYVVEVNVGEEEEKSRTNEKTFHFKSSTSRVTSC